MTATREFMASTMADEKHSPFQTAEEGCENNDSDTTPPTTTPRAANTQSMGGFLAQALEVPSLDHPATKRSSFDEDHEEGETASSSSLTPIQKTSGIVHMAASPPFTMAPISAATHAAVLPQPMDDMVLPLHSDFTIPTSNARFLPSRRVDFEKGPPMEISPTGNNGIPNDSNDDDPNSRRSVFGRSVGKRYKVPTAVSKQQQRNKIPAQPGSLIQHNNRFGDDSSCLSPPASPPHVTYMINKLPEPAVSPLTPAKTLNSSNLENEDVDIPRELMQPRRLLERRTTFHETIHAQSLLLGLAFMAVWSPNNAMAPNLTQMAETFGMSEAERDLYLGSYCALALGVFCLPISALLGFMADFHSRKHLFVCCVVGGSLASAWTGWSQTFVSLFWARLMSGGCMSASVPVAFSLLGDLFSTEERNAASSGLTAMMGLGILLGQVYAGTIGPKVGWQFPFFASSILSLSTAFLVILWVQEPARGAKEKALQGLMQSGHKYERQLTFSGFIHAMRHNRSNTLLLWQGFFTSRPWGIVFVFLNDYLSQEKGFSVPDATFMVMLFGVGCAIGGIVGGYIGQKCQQQNRSMLPLFMAVTTFCGIMPFLGLLNSQFPNKHGYKAMGYSILGGCIASFPSVNVRPCILNVNPPETRGAALTAANLLITLGRGMGPSCITLMGSIFNFSRQESFNITLSVFWTITSIHLLFLAKTLPEDQDSMEEGLHRYAAELAQQQKEAEKVVNGYGTHHENGGGGGLGAFHIEEESIVVPTTPRSVSSEHRYNDGDSLVSIDDYITSFDGIAARQSIHFVQQGFKEMKDEMALFRQACGPCHGGSLAEQDRDDEEAMEDILPQKELRKRQNMWKRQQLQQHQQQLLLSQNDPGDSQNPNSEETPLLGVSV
jgi:predicted MFS family arabinose efflux permease